MVEIITGIATTIGGGFIWYYIQKVLENQISIKRIKSSGDDYVEGLIDLYESYFPNDGTNYTRNEVYEMMNAKFDERRIVDAENIVLAAILKNEVVGFIFCHQYPARQKAIVSYFAVKKGIPRYHKTSLKLLKKLKSILIKNNQCDVLYFEIQGFDSNKALRRLFGDKAISIGLKVHKFDFQYQCPKVSMADNTHEAPFSLFSVGLREEVAHIIPKKEMLEILKFIYLECYGDLYPTSEDIYFEHREHLTKLLSHYENTLPEYISTIDGAK